MFKIGLKSVLAHKRRLLGTSFAVLLGVAFLAGTLVFGDTAKASFDELFTEGNAGVDAVVRGDTELGREELAQRRMVDAELVEDLRGVDGVAAAEPSIEALGQIIGADGASLGGDGPPTLAGNWIDHPELNPYLIAEGRAPQAPGEVVINRGAATAGGLDVGDTTTIRTPAVIEVEIVGIATYGSADRLSGTTFAAFTLEEAQEQLLGGASKVSSIRIQAESGLSAEQIVERLTPHLPEGAEAITAAELTAEQNEEIYADFLGWFEIFLLVFSGIALLVATFTIHNTFAIVLAQRTRESALLRAMGASRGQVLRSIGVESVLIGVVASLLGIAAGIGLAYGMKGFLDAESFAVNTRSVVIPLVVGVTVTLLAGLVPALKASRVAPIAALRDVAVERTSVSWGRVAVGGFLAAAGITMVLGAALGDGGFGLAGLGAAPALVGMVILGPVFARTAGRTIGAPLPRLRGVSGTLARQNAMRNPKRTAGTATALMIGVCVVTLFTVFASSAKSSIDEILGRTFTGDLVIMSSGFSGIGLDPAMADELSALPEVGAVVAGESAVMLLDGEEEVASVAEPDQLASMIDLEVTAGSVADLDDDQLGVSVAMAEANGWDLGSVVEASFADGFTADLTVGAVFENTELTGAVVMPPATWEAHADQRMLDLVLLSFADDADPAAARAGVEGIAEGYGAPEVQDRAEFMESVGAELDQVLTIIYVLLALSILIALMGIGNTLSLSIHERTSELGLLRAVGQTRRQLRSMVRWESVIMAVFGTAGGIGLGLFLGWGLVQASIGDVFTVFDAPPARLAVVLVVGALVGIVAGLLPARRAARLDVLDAIRVE